MNFDDFEYKDKIRLGTPEYKLQMEELKKNMIADLTTNEKYKVFFSKYDPDSIPGFILKFVENKIHLIEHYDIYLEIEEHNKILQYKEETVERFNWIKQKKLWDMQLLWRANKIKIKEVDIANDFEFWGEYIEECPFIPPVEKEEVEALKEYLKLYNIDHIYHLCPQDWQSYSNFIKQEDTGKIMDFPPWYRFYNEYLKKEDLRYLPDIRGEKELHYRRVEFELVKKDKIEALKKNPPPVEAEVPKQKRLHLSYYNAVEYAELFEKDKHYIELFQLSMEEFDHKRKLDPSWEFEKIELCFDLLKEAEVSVEMPADADWRIAIIRCTQQFINDRIIEELDSIFEEYKMLREMNITSGKSTEELKELKSEKWHSKYMAKWILDGRELSGEPRDFNF